MFNSPPKNDELIGCPLEEVIATNQLARRSDRLPDAESEASLMIHLAKELGGAPENFFQILVNTVLELSVAESAGISILDVQAGRFVWPAVAGGLSPHVGSGTPSNFGPCGTVLDRNAPTLFIHPERHFTYLQSITPPLREVLLFPFQNEGKAVGTVWAVIHTRGLEFQMEDRRVLEMLSSFAGSAYQVLITAKSINALSFLKRG